MMTGTGGFQVYPASPQGPARVSMDSSFYFMFFSACKTASFSEPHLGAASLGRYSTMIGE